MEMDIIDEQVETVGRAFMGLTLGCARCHDHKFDPISTEDYYALAGIFKSTKTMEHFTKIARWHEVTIATESERLEHAAQCGRLMPRRRRSRRLRQASKTAAERLKRMKKISTKRLGRKLKATEAGTYEAGSRIAGVTNCDGGRRLRAANRSARTHSRQLSLAG